MQTIQNNINKHLIGLAAVVSMVTLTALPLHTFAYGASFDGGDLKGIDATCSCTGGLTIKVKSYVDNQDHVYMYQAGITQLYANYNVFTSSGYFLTTLVPFAICLDIADDCAGSSGDTPEGIFLLTGTSYNFDADNLMAMLKTLPGASEMSHVITQVQKNDLLVIPKKNEKSRDSLL